MKTRSSFKVACVVLSAGASASVLIVAFWGAMFGSDTAWLWWAVASMFIAILSMIEDPTRDNKILTFFKVKLLIPSALLGFTACYGVMRIYEGNDQHLLVIVGVMIVLLLIIIAMIQPSPPPDPNRMQKI